MPDPKADALLNAAQAGKTDKLKQMLAAGAPIETVDVNRMTPIMLAAQGGHVEAVRVLAEAGANLHALAFRQVDLLEAAAAGGNAEIVSYLLKQGLPVNGHWQPLNDTHRQMGHDTPLIRAVDGANVEVVRILMDAGADLKATHKGRTPAELAQQRHRDPDYADFKQEYAEIAALFGEASPQDSKAAEAAAKEVAEFAKNTHRPEFVRLRERLSEQCGDARPWSPIAEHGLPAANVVTFVLKKCKRQKEWDELRSEAKEAGFHLVLTEPWAPGEDAKLTLFPTNDKLAMVAAIGTEGANHGIDNPDILRWLERLDAEEPLDLVLCNHETLGGAFIAPLKNPQAIAEEMARICPNCLDDMEDVNSFARSLKKSKKFLLRWD